MKVSTALILSSFIGGGFIANSICNKSVDNLRALNRDCVATKPENTTTAQKDFCLEHKPQVPILIPGIHY